jgi:seryl-tRNA synthetase
MRADRLAALTRIGLSWRDSGQAALRGPLLRLSLDCDEAFRRLAARWEAEEERHPATLPASQVQRVDYLRSFPHQATFAVGMDRAEANLDAFLAGPVLDGRDRVAVTALAPVREVLTPAACYHLFGEHEGEALGGPRYLTTRNTCFRREAEYVPLRRLWSFSMREIVCLGTRAETAEFRAQTQAMVDRFVELVDLPVAWVAATDPFFQPQRNPKYLMQRVQPVKHEAMYGGDLAIGSVNSHQDHFGVNFAITRAGEPAYSCCMAFGIERWLYALTDRHGTDPLSWPDLPAAAAQVVVEARAVAEAAAAAEATAGQPPARSTGGGS